MQEHELVGARPRRGAGRLPRRCRRLEARLPAAAAASAAGHPPRPAPPSVDPPVDDLGHVPHLRGGAQSSVAVADGIAVVLSLMAAVIYALGAVCWVASLAFRLTVVPWAAEQTVERGRLPEGFAALDGWAGSLYAVHMVSAYVAFAILGVAVLADGELPRWAGWCGIAGRARVRWRVPGDAAGGSLQPSGLGPPVHRAARGAAAVIVNGDGEDDQHGVRCVGGGDGNRTRDGGFAVTPDEAFPNDREQAIGAKYSAIGAIMDAELAPSMAQARVCRVSAGVACPGAPPTWSAAARGHHSPAHRSPVDHPRRRRLPRRQSRRTVERLVAPSRASRRGSASPAHTHRWHPDDVRAVGTAAARAGAVDARLVDALR
jgi:hypothetical protein